MIAFGMLIVAIIETKK
ncbi:MAG: putative holin-like toxin [Oscillospiraceae bacterium]|nr:putative holin-like toxin [Oscillospiraceae bacterium]MCL2578504.1 putative holin-like toxin [Oscillospiraceae bacterium]